MLPWLNAGQAPQYGAEGGQNAAIAGAGEAAADPDIEEVPDEDA